MPDTKAILMIQNMMQDEVELAWSHVQDAEYPLARKHFYGALEKLAQIEDLSKQPDRISPTLQKQLL